MSIGVTKIALISTPLFLYGNHHHRNRPAVVQRLGLVRLGFAACIYISSPRPHPYRAAERCRDSSVRRGRGALDPRPNRRLPNCQCVPPEGATSGYGLPGDPWPAALRGQNAGSDSAPGLLHGSTGKTSHRTPRLASPLQVDSGLPCDAL